MALKFRVSLLLFVSITPHKIVVMPQNVKAVYNPLGLHRNSNLIRNFCPSCLKLADESLNPESLRFRVIKFADTLIAFFPVAFNPEK